MAQTREQDRQPADKAPRGTKSAPTRDARGGQFVRVQSGDQIIEIPVTKVRLERIARKKSVVGKVISGYADAAAKAKAAGTDFVFAYRVSPDGQAYEVVEIKTAKPAASPLDAAVARAKARGAAKVGEILKGADMLTARDFGALIGASHETVNIKRKRHEILGLEGATRGVKYPRWQVTEAGLPLPGLVMLFDVLGEQPWTVYRFLQTHHAELGGQSALEALKAGQVEAVMGVAQNQAAGAFS